MGLRLVWQPCPLCPALYTVSLRRLGTLPAASFRFHLSVDTLAVRLTLPTTKRVVDFHHQAIAHAGRTAKRHSLMLCLCDEPGGIRTHDLLIRSQTLYPAELRAHVRVRKQRTVHCNE